MLPTSTFANRLRAGCVLLLVTMSVSSTELFAVFVAPDLPSGSQYQIIFVTLERTVASSDDINYYNNFVREQAAMNPDLPDVVWNAIGSTGYVDARDNAPSNGLPIYNTAGQLVVDYPTGIYDSGRWGGLQNLIIFDQYGDVLDGTATLDDHPWTGSRDDGTTHWGYRLGDPGNRVTVGDPRLYGDNWIQGGTRVGNNSRGQPLYALSEPITVPEPSTALLAVAGLAILVCRTRM